MSYSGVYLDLTLAYFLLLVVLNYRVHRSVLYPPFVFTVMWLFDLILVGAGLIEIDTIHGNTLAIVAVGSFAFSAGGLLAGLLPRELFRIHFFPPKPKRMPSLLRNALTLALVCGLPILIYQTWKIAGGTFSLSMAGKAGIEAIENGENQPFIVTYFMKIAIGASMLFATEKKDRQFWIVTFIAFIACVLSGGRTSLMLLIPGLCTIHLLQTKQETLLSALRFLRWPILLFVSLFVGLVFVDKNTDDMVGGALDFASTFFFRYILGPLAAFDSVVQNPSNYVTATSHVFQFPMSLLAKLHLVNNYVKPSQFDSFVFIPFQMNVYTVFKYYLVEFGVAGTFLTMLLIGLFHTLFYLKARQGGRLSMYLFAYSMYTVLLVIFDDHYYAIDGLLHASAIALPYFLIGSLPLCLLPTGRAKRCLLNTPPETSDL